MYDEGKGVPKNSHKALYWYSKAAENMDWQDAFGAYKSGDYEKAIKLLKPLAESGDPEAQYRLGMMYDNGKGVAEDDARAVQWYRKAAQNGHSNAQYVLGLMYSEGSGVPEDDANAVYWFRKAAQNEHIDAQYRLGIVYDKGKGVPEDDAKAHSGIARPLNKGICMRSTGWV